MHSRPTVGNSTAKPQPVQGARRRQYELYLALVREVTRPGRALAPHGLWLGGYNPRATGPNPQADPTHRKRPCLLLHRVSLLGNGASTGLRVLQLLDDDHPGSGCAGSYWGNALLTRAAFMAVGRPWACLESTPTQHRIVTTPVHVSMVWKNDLLQRFPMAGRSGTGCSRPLSAHLVPMASQCRYSSTAPGPLDIPVPDKPYASA